MLATIASDLPEARLDEALGLRPVVRERAPIYDAPTVAIYDLGRVAGGAHGSEAYKEEAPLSVSPDEARAADFALRIAGDSMLPLFQPGDLAGIQETGKRRGEPLPHKGGFVLASKEEPVGLITWAFKRYDGHTEKDFLLFSTGTSEALYWPRRWTTIKGVYRWLKRGVRAR